METNTIILIIALLCCSQALPGLIILSSMSSTFSSAIAFGKPKTDPNNPNNPNL